MSDQAAQTLNLDEFAAHFERAAPVLWCVAAAALGSRDAAEDMVQEAALVAMARLTTFRAGTDFTAWMIKIVRHLAMNQMRRIRREPGLLDPDLPDPIAPSTGAPVVSAAGDILPDQTALDDRVLGELRSLPEAQRSCLLLRTVLELSYDEIGATLTIPTGTAMSHVHRARQQLADRLRSDSLPATDARSAR